MDAALRNFFHGIAVTMEEYQVQCQLASFDAAMMRSRTTRPAFRLDTQVAREVSEKRLELPRLPPPSKPADVRYTVEVISSKPPEWLDEQLVSLATRTRKPLGQCFIKKLRHIFPSLSRGDLTLKIKRLINLGRIIDGSATPAAQIITEEANDRAEHNPTPEPDPEPLDTDMPENPTQENGNDTNQWNEPDVFFETSKDSHNDMMNV